MKLYKIMPLSLATIFLVFSIVGHRADWDKEYDFFFLGGMFFFLSVCFIIEAIENINIDDK